MRDKTWAQHHKVAHLNALGQYCKLMGVKDAAGLLSNYITEELEGEEDNIIQVQACVMVEDKRMKGISKDFLIPSLSTANYSPFLTSPILSMSLDTIFACVFVHFQLNFIPHSLPHLSSLCLSLL